MIARALGYLPAAALALAGLLLTEQGVGWGWAFLPAAAFAFTLARVNEYLNDRYPEHEEL